MNNLNFTVSGKESSRKTVHGNCMTISVKEFITPELAEKTAKALWNKPEWADSIVRFNYDNKIKSDCFNVIALNETGDVVGSIAFRETLIK